MKIDVSFLDELDQLIKNGEARGVAEHLRAVDAERIPRRHLARLSGTALRVGEPKLAFLWLRPYELVPAEKIQYAMTLKQMGAPQVALRIFAELEGPSLPEAWLYGAVTLFTQARHSEAIPKLESYLSIDTLTAYQKLIGRLNLATALLFECRYPEADKLLAAISDEALRADHRLILGNSFELRAQSTLLQGDLPAAEKLLDEAAPLIERTAPVYRLFLAKWKAILSLRKSKAAPSSLQQLQTVREWAAKEEHWETLRECDFYQAAYTADLPLAQLVYFGSPYEAFRRRLIEFFPGGFEPPEAFEWRGPLKGPSTKGPRLSLDGRPDDSLTARILRLLASDFYHPIKSLTLFVRLYPQEKVDPDIALPRVFNAVSRTRAWLKKEKIPVDIGSIDEGYRFIWQGPVTVVVPRLLDVEAPEERMLKKLSAAFADREFSSSDAVAVLDQPRRTVARFLGNLQSTGHLACSGQGRRTRYSVLE
jgi:hypothetical protein